MSANLSANSDEIVELNHRFSFESAHHLPEVPEDHKCRRLHGHSFQVEVTVSGSIGHQTGWVMDFADLKARVRPVIEALDHRYLPHLGTHLHLDLESPRQGSAGANSSVGQ